MPLAQSPVVTTSVVSSGAIVSTWEVELPPNFTGYLVPSGLPIVTQNLAVNNLPKVWIWAQQLEGPPGATFQPMYSIGPRQADNPDNEPDWRPITNDLILVAGGVPCNWNTNVRFPIYAFGVRFTNPDNTDSVRLTVVLGACQ